MPDAYVVDSATEERRSHPSHIHCQQQHQQLFLYLPAFTYMAHGSAIRGPMHRSNTYAASEGRSGISTLIRSVPSPGGEMQSKGACGQIGTADLRFRKTQSRAESAKSELLCGISLPLVRPSLADR